MPSSSIREYIKESESLMQEDKQLGDASAWDQETVKEWLDKYHACIKRLSSALSKAKKLKMDFSAITTAENILRKLHEREKEIRKFRKDYKAPKEQPATPTPLNVPYVKFSLLYPEDEKDEERDKLSEMIYKRLEQLRSYIYKSPISELRRTEREWRGLLDKTTDISSRQIIKEGLNDCWALRKQFGIDYDTRAPLPPKPSLKSMKSPTLSDDYSSGGIYARVSIAYGENKRYRTVDGDVMMFFCNGDVVVL